MEFLPDCIEDGPKSIYINKDCSLSCIISEEDYEWALQWKWSFVYSKNKRKMYAKRATRIKGKPVSIYLHKEICVRALGLPPTERHIVGDHIDGNSLNNTRDNLRWATAKENRNNYFGFYALQMRMAFLENDPNKILFGKEIYHG